VLKDGDGTVKGTGGQPAVGAAGAAGGTGDPVVLGLAVHIGNAGLGQLVLDVGGHFISPWCCLVACFEHAAKAAPRGSGRCPVSRCPAA
jgi:hypothetical protein